MRFVSVSLSVIFAAALMPAAFCQSARPAAPVSFTRDIRRILSDNCMACHGPDEKERKAGLRLDTREGVLRTVAARKPELSPLFQRMKMTGPGQMPPPGFLRRPTAKQVEMVGEWIRQGAKWEQHWAYTPLAKLAPPNAAKSTWPKNEVDRFILARLKAEGLAPSPEADRRTLLRRLTFDLTGLPPTFEEVQRFIADRSPDGYEKAVDRLLSSERYGERVAVVWLDLVRYADTRGYHGDQHQEISPYRDYVIDSFNRNMPFDQFTREQIAGDLLPNQTQEARIASGYNKLLMTTEEGGSQPKEYMAKYAADRVRNVSAVWMGSTMGCCQCHDHKYDPFTTRDFYSMAAFFADVKQTPVGGLDVTPLPTPEESAEIARITGLIGPLQAKLDTQSPELDSAQSEWEKANSGTLKKPDNIAAILGIEAAKRSDKQKQDVAAYYRSVSPLLAATRAERQKLQGQLDAVNGRVRKTMITTTVSPAEIRVLPRGNWLDESGPVVEPAIPTFLDRLNAAGRRANRLDLADWLTSKRNPLTARVMANRMWAMLFGRGLCRSMEDFGAQGVPPTHPALLDWLATDYMENGWNTKRLIKDIVMSAAYRQSSVPTAAAAKRDPANDLFARQGRHRLDAEFVRDNALAVSGLLVNRLGGSSVKPYQPAHFWDYLNFPTRTWVHDKNEDEYRRGLYTYWCRTYLQPSLSAFDAPSREECCSARVVSNTPQQALVLLNDPTYVEAARVLAERIMKEGGAATPDRIRTAYRIALQRNPTPKELQTIQRVVDRHRDEYDADRTAAKDVLTVGERPADPSLQPSDLAAWTSVARILLNLHESITRN